MFKAKKTGFEGEQHVTVRILMGALDPASTDAPTYRGKSDYVHSNSSSTPCFTLTLLPTELSSKHTGHYWERPSTTFTHNEKPLTAAKQEAK